MSSRDSSKDSCKDGSKDGSKDSCRESSRDRSRDSRWDSSPDRGGEHMGRDRDRKGGEDSNDRTASDRQLRDMIVLGCSGELEARWWVIERLQPVIIGDIRRRYGGLSVQMREDIAENTAMKLFHKFDYYFRSYDQERSPLPYCRTVVGRSNWRMAKSELNKARTPSVDVGRGGQGESLPAPEKVREGEVLLGVIQKWAAKKRQSDQAIFWERIFSGRSSKAVGEEIGKKANTVDQRVKVLRSELSEFLRGKGYLVGLLMCGLYCLLQSFHGGSRWWGS